MVAPRLSSTARRGQRWGLASLVAFCRARVNRPPIGCRAHVGGEPLVNNPNNEVGGSPVFGRRDYSMGPARNVNHWARRHSRCNREDHSHHFFERRRMT